MVRFAQAVSGGSGSSSSHHGQNPLFVEQLMNMGFPENRAVKGLIKTGGNNVQSAMDWIFAHMDDNDIDDEVTPDPMDVRQLIWLFLLSFRRFAVSNMPVVFIGFAKSAEERADT